MQSGLHNRKHIAAYQFMLGISAAFWPKFQYRDAVTITYFMLLEFHVIGNLFGLFESNNDGLLTVLEVSPHLDYFNPALYSPVVK